MIERRASTLDHVNNKNISHDGKKQASEQESANWKCHDFSRRHLWLSFWFALLLLTESLYAEQIFNLVNYYSFLLLLL